MKLCWFVVEVSREASSVFFISFYQSLGLDVFYHWYFSGNSSVHVSQNIEISSYFGQHSYELLAKTQVSPFVVQSTLRKSFHSCFFVTFRNSGRFSKGPKGMKKMAAPLVLVKTHAGDQRIYLHLPFLVFSAFFTKTLEEC